MYFLTKNTFKNILTTFLIFEHVLRHMITMNPIYIAQPMQLVADTRGPW